MAVKFQLSAVTWAIESLRFSVCLCCNLIASMSFILTCNQKDEPISSPTISRFPLGLPKTTTTSTCVHIMMPAVPSITASPSAAFGSSTPHSGEPSECTSPSRQPMISSATIHNVDLDQVRERVTTMTHSEKILRIVTFTAQYACFPAVTCAGINQKCAKCQKKLYSRWSWIFEPSQFKEKTQVSVRKCQIKAGM